MTNAPTQDNDARPNNRDTMLSDIGNKWDKFSQQDLSALKSNDDLVTQVVAKYAINRIAAQRDVDALMAGRHLTA